MRVGILTVGLVLILLTIGEKVDAYELKKERYEWKYNTLAHQLLEKEEEISGFSLKQKIDYFDPRYGVIDKLIAQVVDLTVKKGISPSETDKVKIEGFFKLTENVLINTNFVYCDLVNSYFEALTPRNLNDFNCKKVGKGEQLAKYKADSSTKFYGLDSDHASIIYYSIGQVLKLPLKVVELPEHYFIRWRVSEGKYFNWDIFDGQLLTDDEYAAGKGNFYTTAISNEEQILCHYLQDMDSEELTKYYMGVLADIHRQEGRYISAIQSYEKAIDLRPHAAATINNFAWMFLTTPALRSKGLYRRAYELSKEVNRINPSSKFYKSTYSCACAGIGLFEKAIKLEKQAFANSKKLDGYRKGLTCVTIVNEETP